SIEDSRYLARIFKESSGETFFSRGKDRVRAPEKLFSGFGNGHLSIDSGGGTTIGGTKGSSHLRQNTEASKERLIQNRQIQVTTATVNRTTLGSANKMKMADQVLEKMERQEF
ncbi:hypothetical protein Ancab_019204, partial [Ancistrocladus abbreviatus]